MTTTKPAVPRSIDELTETVKDLLAAVRDPGRELGGASDGYSKCAEAMWQAGYAALEFAAHELSVTGFQHSYAALKLYAELMRIEGPFIIVKAEEALYPQYNLPRKVQKFLDDNKEWLAEEARKKLDNDSDYATKGVIEHWKKLAET